MSELLELCAYRLHPQPALRLVAATVQRDFLAATRDRFALRCLPMLLANQAGWMLVSDQSITATWNGGIEMGDVTVSSPPGAASPAVSHFGHGIVTFHIPYLFRTPPGFNLWVRGPSNLPKDGAAPLEGIVETDWSPATFTMNWQLTRAGLPVSFAAGEPVCMILPVRRGALEQFHPVIRPIESDPAVHDAHRAWAASRSQFLRELPDPSSDARRKLWERHYFQGTAPDGISAAEHETRLALREFEVDDGGGTKA